MLLRSRLLISAAFALTCVARPARAQAPPESPISAASPQPLPRPPADARPWIGVGAAIGGVVMGVTGAVLFATAPPPTLACEPWCTQSDGSQAIRNPRFGGAGLMGGGLALLALGVPLYLTTSSGSAKPHWSESRMTAGVVVTTLGLAFVGVGAGVLLDATTERDRPNTLGALLFYGTPVLLSGVLAIGIGIPLWVSGASPPPAPAARQPVVTRPEVSLGPRSVGLRFRF